MKVEAFSALLAIFGSAQAGSTIRDRDAEKCVACHGLANHVDRRLQDTEARANEPVSIGKRLNANGEEVPSRCNEVLHEQEDEISSWFHESRRTGNFFKEVCEARINGCNAQVVEEFLAKSAKQVEIEDEPPSKKTEKKEAPKSTPPKKEAPKEAPKKEATKEQPAFDALAIINKIVNRIKGNMIRIYRLSFELGNEMTPIIKTKNWEKLKTTLKNKEFYQKYWIVFAAFASVIYLLASFVEMIFGKSEKRDRRATSTKRRTTKSKKEE